MEAGHISTRIIRNGRLISSFRVSGPSANETRVTYLLTLSDLHADIHYCIAALGYQLTVHSRPEESLNRNETFDRLRNRLDDMTTACSRRGSIQIPQDQSSDDGHQSMADASSRVLQAFLYLWHRKPTQLICCTSIQQAANAAMLLVRAACAQGDGSCIPLIKEVRLAFAELLRKGTHQAFEPVVQSITDGLVLIDCQ